MSENIKKVIIVCPRREEGFYSQFDVKDPMTPEGPIIIATIIEQTLECDVSVIDESITPLDEESYLWQEIAKTDVIGISAMTCLENRGYEILRKAKQLNPNIICLAGGFGPSSNPEKALKSGADIVIIGEGVEIIKELILALENSNGISIIKGIAWERGGNFFHTPPRELVKDMDDIPFAKFELVVNYQEINSRVITLTGGCPRRCKFCSAWKFYGATYRYRSPENAAAYVEHAIRGHRETWWNKEVTVFLADDNIAGNPEWTKNFLDCLDKVDLKRVSISVEMRAEVCRNTELMEKMKGKIGCIFFGFEDITEEGLLSVDKKQSPEDIVFAIKECHRLGIKVAGMFIFGLDPHTENSGIEMARFALKYLVDFFILFIRCPLVGTDDTVELLKSSRILKNIPTEYSDCLFTVFEPLNMTPKELQRAHLKAIKHFYSIRQAIRDRVSGRIDNMGMLYRLIGAYYVRKVTPIVQNFIKRYL